MFITTPFIIIELLILEWSAIVQFFPIIDLYIVTLEPILVPSPIIESGDTLASLGIWTNV